MAEGLDYFAAPVLLLLATNQFKKKQADGEGR